MSKSSYIRFDWAIKRLLRQKANFVVLEGFLSVLLNESIKIVEILESESNKTTPDDKFNRIDLLARNQTGELVIIEVQNERELDYFHRILYGVSKAITEYIHESQAYSNVRKVYSVSILYFELGQGKDYLYRGRTDFKGVFEHDTLMLSASQADRFRCSEAGDLYPEYYILRVEEFDKAAATPLDEWFSFLKTGDISEQATAPGLPEARERLRRDRMNRAEQKEYDAHVEALRYQKSVIETGRIEGKAEGLVEGEAIGLEKGKAEGLAERNRLKAEKEAVQAEKEAAQAKLADVVINSNNAGIPVETISTITGLPVEEIIKIIKAAE